MHFISRNINFIFLIHIIFCTINDKLIIMAKLNLFFVIFKKILRHLTKFKFSKKQIAKFYYYYIILC